MLGPEDLETFRAIRLESLRRAPWAFANTEADWTALPDDEWRARLSNPVFVAFAGTEPVGIMGLLRQKGQKTSHRATLIMVYLRDDRRGNGLARELLDHVIAFARAEAIGQLELQVSESNRRAIAFYLRAGFAQIGRIPAATIHDGVETADLLMARRLIGPVADMVL